MLSEQAERWLPYPAGALFDIAVDVESYPHYLPGWITARITGQQEDVRHAEQLVGFGPVRMRFRSKATLHRPQWIEVSSDDTQFRRMRLLWRFDVTETSSCRVALSVELELRSRLLQYGLEHLGPAVARDALLAFERRARQLLGPPPLPGASVQ